MPSAMKFETKVDDLCAYFSENEVWQDAALVEYSIQELAKAASTLCRTMKLDTLDCLMIPSYYGYELSSLVQRLVRWAFTARTFTPIEKKPLMPRFAVGHLLWRDSIEERHVDELGKIHTAVAHRVPTNDDLVSVVMRVYRTSRTNGRLLIGGDDNLRQLKQLTATPVLPSRGGPTGTRLGDSLRQQHVGDRLDASNVPMFNFGVRLLAALRASTVFDRAQQDESSFASPRHVSLDPADHVNCAVDDARAEAIQYRRKQAQAYFATVPAIWQRFVKIHTPNDPLPPHLVPRKVACYGAMGDAVTLNGDELDKEDEIHEDLSALVESRCRYFYNGALVTSAYCDEDGAWSVQLVHEKERRTMSAEEYADGASRMLVPQVVPHKGRVVAGNGRPTCASDLRGVTPQGVIYDLAGGVSWGEEDE